MICNTSRGMRYAKTRPRVGLVAGLVAFATTVALSAPVDAKKGRPVSYGPQTSFSGTVVSRELGKHGNVSHVVLNNGTRLHFRRDQAAMAGGLRVGRKVSGSGYWTTRREGRAIAATALGR